MNKNLIFYIALVFLAGARLLASEVNNNVENESTEPEVTIQTAAVPAQPEVEEENPTLDKILGRRGAIERRMSEAAEKKRMARENSKTVSATVTPKTTY